MCVSTESSFLHAVDFGVVLGGFKGVFPLLLALILLLVPLMMLVLQVCSLFVGLFLELNLPGGPAGVSCLLLKTSNTKAHGGCVCTVKAALKETACSGELH